MSNNPIWLKVAAPAALLLLGYCVALDEGLIKSSGGRPMWDGASIPECDSDGFQRILTSTLKKLETRINAKTLKTYPFRLKAFSDEEKYRECEGVVMLSNGWTPNYIARMFVEDGQLFLKLTPTTLNAR